jgi:hypothetical protein
VQYLSGTAFTFLTSSPKLMLYCSTLDVQKAYSIANTCNVLPCG